MFSASPQWTVYSQRRHSHTNNTTTCLETNNHKCLSVWFNAVLFLDTQVCWQSAHSRKLKGKWIQHENKQRPGLQQKGRLFIVWVCLQIYCADTRQLFFLLFLSLAHEHSQKQQGTQESYSEHDAWRFPTIPSDVRDLNDFAGVSIKVTTEIS